MLPVRQVARPDGALLCAVKLLPDGAVRFPYRQLLPDGAVLCAVELLPDVPCGRMRVPMLLVRQVARPDGALLCTVKLLPDGAVRFPCRQLLPDGAVLCAVELIPDGALHLSCWQLPLDGVTGSRGESPRNGFRGAATSSAQTFASLHPSRSASLAGSSHSRGTWASTVCAEEFPTPREMPVH